MRTTFTGTRLRRSLGSVAVLAASALAVLGLQAAPAAAAVPAPSHAAADRSSSGLQPACPTAEAGEATCFALRYTGGTSHKGLSAAVTPAGLGPADLQSAYDLPTDGGAGQTVAIVDAYDDPTVEADLAVYRQQYGLPACTTDNGCFSKVDQRGGSDYPAPNTDWAGEISLDVDMVSAIAPQAHILLVEADSNAYTDLGAGVDTAVTLGAKFVSNSYGEDYRFAPGEQPSDPANYDAHYDHPGVAVLAAAGDYGYGVSYPASSQYVTAVGGTELTRDPTAARGWSESVWENGVNGTGSGCSAYEPKPAFQQDTGCAQRSVADVSAVADNVAVYNTYSAAGWERYAGTSVSTPVLAGVYADAGTPAPGTYPNSYPYQLSGTGLNDVTTGADGTCGVAYECTAGPGYDGPTGLGTPDGLLAFRSGPHGRISGTVTGASGKPIGHVTVSGGGGTAHTDAQGRYSLTLPAGTYDLTVSAFGYASQTLKGVSFTDGGDLTRDVALKTVPSRTVTGKVTDGSGHGWPLYAEITVDGQDAAPVWTDPVTGSYRIALPEGHDYTLRYASSLPGYEAGTKDVSVGATAPRADVALTVDRDDVTAPGYTVNLSGTTETFDSTDSAPQGWSVVNAPGTKQGWTFGDPNMPNQTGGQGGFASIDSNEYGQLDHQDTQLVSPAYDFSDVADPDLTFDTEYNSATGQTMTVDATSDGGTTWTTVWTAPRDSVVDGHLEVPLTAFAGQKNVQVRFHFTATWGWWWGIDDVLIGARSVDPVPGGLVVGTVSDANTGQGLVGATVTSQDDPDASATTGATPDDPATPDGYYALFSAAGRHTLSVAKPQSPYATTTKTVTVRADRAVSAPVKLAAGRLVVSPSAVKASVRQGGRTTKRLTIRNTGGAPATATLSTSSGAGWLTAGTTQISLAPGARTTVTLTLDSADPSVTGPGDAVAQLTLSGNTPYTVPPVPVTLHIKPAKGAAGSGR